MVASSTKRLTLRHFTEHGHEFVYTLLNDESFIKNIGDKEIHNKEDAINYLRNGPIASYKEQGFGLNLVCLKCNNAPIGMCGLLKRPDLQYVDLGFAFLPEYCGQGFAQEASISVLNDGYKNHNLKKVLAITLPSNIRSNHLLKKLGFLFKEQVEFYSTTNNLYKLDLASFYEN